MEIINQQNSRKENKRIVIGLLLIALAGLLLADNFDLLPCNWEHYVFTWPTALIVVGIICLAKYESKVAGIILITIGAIFLAARYYYFPFSIHHLFWPTILAVLGILLIVRKKNQHLFSGREK